MITQWSKENTAVTILKELDGLFEQGVASLSNKLQTAGTSHSSTTLSESVLVAARIADLWSFFFTSVVPSIQGFASS
jgi:hypothetical protein